MGHTHSCEVSGIRFFLQATKMESIVQQNIVFLSTITSPTFLTGFMAGAGFASFFLFLFLSIILLLYFQFPFTNKISPLKPIGVTLSGSSVKGMCIHFLC